MELKEKIIHAAMVQFQEKGLKFTMNDVAQSMHIAKKTIYQFFASKDELLIAMLDDGFDGIQKNKQEILNSDLPLLEKLEKVMIAIPDQYDVFDFRLLSDLHDKYPAVNEHLARHLEEDWEPVNSLIEEGIRQNKIRKISVPIFKKMFTSSIESFLSDDMLKKENINYRTALKEMMIILMKGITQNED